MLNFSSMKKPYRAVMEGKWEDLEEIFDNDEGFSISYPIMTVAKDNSFHIAVHSKSEQPLKHLLERVNHEQILTNVLYTNAYENTVLHEAAINHNIKAVKLLVEGRLVTPDQPERSYVTPKQLLERNKSGQTPLFKAAAFGSTKLVKYLASQPNQMTYSDNGHKKLQDAHRTKNDGTSLLHAAVRGEHSGTALELLKLDQGLAELKTQNGMTSLHLLTNLRSAFTNKFSDHLWHRLLYFCIPTGHDNYDDADNISEDEYDDKAGDNQILETIKKSFWKYFIGDSRCPTTMRNIWKEKRKRKFAFKLARELIKNDDSWHQSYTEETTENYRSPSDGPIQVQIIKPDDHQVEIPVQIIESGDLQTLDIVEDKEDPTMKQPAAAEDKHQVETPLLAATRTGVIELVKEILEMHPQAVEHVSHKKQNILHVAASYRQRKVFELVKQMHMPTSRLILGIDEESYTVLHHVADTN